MNTDVLSHIGVFAGIDERRVLGFLPNRLPKDGRYAMLDQALQRRAGCQVQKGDYIVHLAKIGNLTYSVAFDPVFETSVYCLEHDRQYWWHTEIRHNGDAQSIFALFDHARSIPTYVVQERYVGIHGHWICAWRAPEK
jgi:hypothetical protein